MVDAYSSKKTYIWQLPGWPNFQIDHDRLESLITSARQVQGMIIGKASAIGLTAIADVHQQLWIDEVIATSAIEGEQLNPDSVRSSVLRKLGMKYQVIYDPRSEMIDGLVAIMDDALTHHDEELNHERLCSWHRAIFSKDRSIKAMRVGGYRTHAELMQIVSGLYRREKVHYVAPPSEEMHDQMDQFLNWFEVTRPNIKGHKAESLDGICRAAIAHLWFESIHPFEDGNGRLGRVILDMALAQDYPHSMRIYSISNQIMRNRSSYYDALEKAQSGDLEITNWLIWFLNTFIESCKTSSRFIDDAIAKSQFWQRHANRGLSERHRKVIQKLIEAGDGGFLGGLTTEKYQKITKVSKATATRDLGILKEWDILFTSGEGKATRYYLRLGNWQHGLDKT